MRNSVKLLFTYTQSCPKLQGTKSNMTRIYYYWVIYLCCNGGQSAWQGSWHTWHVTPWSWLMSQSISGHGPWSGTEGPRVRADNWGRVIITTLCRIKSWRGRHSGHSFVVLGDWNIKTRIKGLLYLRSKPRASEDLFWLDWVFASELTRHGWQWSCSHKRQFSLQARFWFFRRLNPVSNVRWEEGRKETTTLLLISRGFSTWDSEA